MLTGAKLHWDVVLDKGWIGQVTRLIPFLFFRLCEKNYSSLSLRDTQTKYLSFK